VTAHHTSALDALAAVEAAEHEEMAAWCAMRRVEWIAACEAEADALAGVEADAAPALPWEVDYE